MSLGRVKLHRLLGGCRQQPMPIHSLVAAGTSGFWTTASVFRLLPQALTLALAVNTRLVFPTPRIVNCRSCLVLHLALVPAYLALGLHNSQTLLSTHPTYGNHECKFLWSTSAWGQRVPEAVISCLSGRPRIFLGPPLLCHASSLRISSQQSTPVLFLGSNP